MEKQFIAVIIIFILIAVTVVIFLVKALLKIWKVQGSVRDS